MKYIRSSTLNESLSLDGLPLDDVALRFDRQHLVDQFNAIVGSPGTVAHEMQEDFVNGRMPHQEMVSFIRFCEYMIHTAQEQGAAGVSHHPVSRPSKSD